MGQGSSVITNLCADWLPIVKYLKLKATFRDFRQTVNIFASFEKADADGGHDIVIGMVKDLFFEYDAVFPGVVRICEFNGFCTHDLIKLEIFYVCLDLDLQLSFSCVVGQVAFYEHDEAGVFFR